MTEATRSGGARPTWRKLGLAPDGLLVLDRPPPGWLLPDLPPDVEIQLAADPPKPCRLLLAFFREASELSRLERLTPAIYPDGALWVAWPRKAAGHVSDLGDTVVREAALPLGIVDVKVAMIDEDWSGLCFVWRVERR